MSLFRRSQNRQPKRSNASWVYMESPDSVFVDSLKTNGSVGLEMPSNGHISDGRRSPNLSLDKLSEERKTGQSVKRCLFENLLTLITLLGVVVGIILGIGLRSAKIWTKREIMYINFPGELFLSMLKCLILPLIVSSLIAAVGSLDVKLTGKIGLRAVVYYLTTTVLAIVLGIILVTSIRPGSGTKAIENKKSEETRYSLPEDTLMDLVRHMFPPNIMEATIMQYNTVLKVPSGSNVTENDTDTIKTWDFNKKLNNQTNILGIVIFSIVLGITLASMKHRGKPLLDVFICLSDAMMIITKAVIWLSPVGVLFLVASKIMEMEDVSVIAGQVGLYTATVFVGIMAHGFIVLPLIYLVLTRKNPLTFILNMGQALATAFGTASSSATLPVTIACLEEKNYVDPRVTRFVIPIGATINMDGTALYEAVAAIFIAQVRGMTLTVGTIIAISITATAASVGAAGIPQAGLVTMVMVLNVVGLPVDDVALILIVDWILDRFRTLINVLGDALGAGIVAHFSKDDLAELEDNENFSTEMTTL